MSTRRPSQSSTTKLSERPQRKATQRITATHVAPAKGESMKVESARPDPATTMLLQILAEEIDDLRSEVQALREELAVVRALGPARKVTGGYRGVTKADV
jgi:hypothetical protein